MVLQFSLLSALITYYQNASAEVSYLAHVAKNDYPLQRILTWCRGRGETILLTPSEFSVFQLMTYLVIVSIATHTNSHHRHYVIIRRELF